MNENDIFDLNHKGDDDWEDPFQSFEDDVINPEEERIREKLMKERERYLSYKKERMEELSRLIENKMCDYNTADRLNNLFASDDRLKKLLIDSDIISKIWDLCEDPFLDRNSYKALLSPYVSTFGGGGANKNVRELIRLLRYQQRYAKDQDIKPFRWKSFEPYVCIVLMIACVLYLSGNIQVMLIESILLIGSYFVYRLIRKRTRRAYALLATGIILMFLELLPYSISRALGNAEAFPLIILFCSEYILVMGFYALWTWFYRDRGGKKLSLRKMIWRANMDHVICLGDILLLYLAIHGMNYNRPYAPIAVLSFEMIFFYLLIHYFVSSIPLLKNISWLKKRGYGSCIDEFTDMDPSIGRYEREAEIAKIYTGNQAFFATRTNVLIPYKLICSVIYERDPKKPGLYDITIVTEDHKRFHVGKLRDEMLGNLYRKYIVPNCPGIVLEAKEEKKNKKRFFKN